MLYQLSYVPKGVKLAKGLFTLRERESSKRLIEKSSKWSLKQPASQREQQTI